MVCITGDHWPIKNELPSSSRLMITARQQIAGNSNHRIRSSVAGDLATLYEPLYRLQAVGHSLGATSLLIYAVMCKILGRPHYLSKMVLLTPAGFHYKYPTFAWPFLYVLPTVMRLLNSWRPDMVRLFAVLCCASTLYPSPIYLIVLGKYFIF